MTAPAEPASPGLAPAKPPPVSHREVQGAGVRLAVQERGPEGAPVIVAVHGFPDTHAVWEPVADLLARTHRVVTYDVRGAGASSDPGPHGFGLDLLVADLEAVLDALPGGAAGGTDRGRAVHLLAHDWGSIQAWEAVTTPRLAPRFASYTSISGPPLDHAGLSARRRARGSTAERLAGMRQAVHSWYILAFHLPLVPRLARWAARRRSEAVRRLWARASARLEGATPDADWPPPTFAGDLARGIQLYRANVGPRLRHPTVRHTPVPVQLILPEHDRYVTPDLLIGLEEWTDRCWKRPVPYGHWVVRTHPEVVATAVTELVTFLEGGAEAPALRAAAIRG